MGCASETRRANQNRRARAGEGPRKCRPSYEWQHYLTADVVIDAEKIDGCFWRLCITLLFLHRTVRSENVLG
jgi:hypothetical protein